MRSIVLFAVLMTCLCSCSPRQLEVQVQGLQPLHVNEYGESTSVNVRFYQLKHDGKFRDGLFDEIWTKPKTALEGDIVGDPREITVFPHEPKLKEEAAKHNIGAEIVGTQFIGILAMYRQDGGQTDQRRLVIPADEIDDITLYCYEYVISTEKPVELYPEPPAKDRRVKNKGGSAK